MINIMKFKDLMEITDFVSKLNHSTSPRLRTLRWMSEYKLNYVFYVNSFQILNCRTVIVIIVILCNLYQINQFIPDITMWH